METRVALLVALFLAESCNALSWGYQKYNGPELWGDHYDDCNGNSQSPIHINADDVEIDYSLPIVNRMLFYDPPTKMKLTNNGHTVVIAFEGGEYVLKKGELLPFEAKIVQVHFHWGENPASPGSEHELDGKKFFGEVHAVHYNTKYANISEAADKPDGLAVLAWWIDASYPQTNQAMRHFFRLAKISAPFLGMSKYIRQPFSLESIIPADLAVYFRYNGSLTTPGCYESVTWTVFQKPIRISPNQAEFLAKKFFKGEDSSTPPIQNNFRPVQPLNGRKILRPAPLVIQKDPAEEFISDLII